MPDVTLESLITSGVVATQADVDGHVNDATAAHAASAVGFTPASGIAATDVQAAIVEAVTDQTAYVDARAKLGKYNATVPPTGNDDSADGYAVGSIWVDVTGDDAFICVDASVGAAIWVPFDAGGSTGPLLYVDNMALDAAGSDFADMAGWTAIGTASAAAAVDAYDATCQDIAMPAHKDGYYKAIDAGDWTYYLTIHGITNSTPAPATALAGMVCLAVFNNAGDGTGVAAYSDGACYFIHLTAGAYSGIGPGVQGWNGAHPVAATNWPIVYRLAKVGTTLTMGISYDGGLTWFTNTRVDATVFTRVGIIHANNAGGTNVTLRVGRFNLVP